MPDTRFPTHEELIAAGYKWDGMDGYTAPDVCDEPCWDGLDPGFDPVVSADVSFSPERYRKD